MEALGGNALEISQWVETVLKIHFCSSERDVCCDTMRFSLCIEMPFLENGAAELMVEPGSVQVWWCYVSGHIWLLHFLFYYSCNVRKKNLMRVYVPRQCCHHFVVLGRLLSILRCVNAVLCNLYMWHFTLWHFEYKETFIASDFQGCDKLYKAISLKIIHQDPIKPWSSTVSEPVGSN